MYINNYNYNKKLINTKNKYIKLILKVIINTCIYKNKIKIKKKNSSVVESLKVMNVLHKNLNFNSLEKWHIHIMEVC